MMEILYLYCFICYLLALVAFHRTKHMPWFILIIAPYSVLVTIAYIYCDALNEAFGDD